MFAYCRNNSVCRNDLSGTADANFFSDDGEIFTNEDLLNRSGGGLDMFLQSLQDAANGLSMAVGNRNYQSSERHHVFSNKNKTYTPQFKEIADRYDYSLNSEENILMMQGHKGRHTNAYHEFMLIALQKADAFADGDHKMFYECIQIVFDFLYDNPWLPYARK